MRQFNQLVFDEVIYGDTHADVHGSMSGYGYVGTFYTSYTYDYLLGQYDQLAIQAIADDVTGKATFVNLQVAIETSCDGRHWVPKKDVLNPEIDTTLSMTGTTLLPWGWDDGQRPNYVFVRLRIYIVFADYPGSAHLMIHVTARDSGGVTVRAAEKSMYQIKPLPHVETSEERIRACISEGYLPGDCRADEVQLQKEKSEAKSAGKKK